MMTELQFWGELSLFFFFVCVCVCVCNYYSLPKLNSKLETKTASR